MKKIIWNKEDDTFTLNREHLMTLVDFAREGISKEHEMENELDIIDSAEEILIQTSRLPNVDM